MCVRGEALLDGSPFGSSFMPFGRALDGLSLTSPALGPPFIPFGWVLDGLSLTSPILGPPFISFGWLWMDLIWRFPSLLHSK